MANSSDPENPEDGSANSDGPIPSEPTIHAPRPPDFLDPRDEKIDEIEASRMPILAHLTELRARLIWVLVGLGGAFIVALFFSRYCKDRAPQISTLERQ